MKTTPNAIEDSPEPQRQAPGDEAANRRAATAFDLDGNILTLDRLPPPDTKRWVAHRKAEVVAAVRGGLLSLSDACERYALTVEEFLSWQQAVRRHGLDGLYVGRYQQYRNAVMPGLRANQAQQYGDAEYEIPRQKLPGRQT